MPIRPRLGSLARPVALVLVMASFCLAAPAQAECFSACYDNYSSCASSSSLQGLCEGQRDVCLQQCRSGRVPGGGGGGGPLPSANWAYIMYDTATGLFGTASGTPNGQAAMAQSRAQCAKRGGKRCDFPLSARDGCVAVAAGARGTGLTGWQTSRGNGGRPVLRQRVLAECRRQGGQQCAIKAEVCSWD